MKQQTRSRRIRWLALTLGMLVSTNSFAPPTPKPLVFSSLVNPTFGDLLAGVSGRNFILGTNGAVSGIDAADYVSGAAAGSLLITGDASTSVSIQATNLIADGGVSIVNITCNYDATGDQDCITGFTGAPPRSQGRILLIGMEINTTTTHGDNDTAAPSFDIVVNYI